MSALDIQIGGDHYKNFKIQPIKFSVLNNLGFIEGCIVKRICRYQSQEDPIKDLDKIIHEIQIIKEIRQYETAKELIKRIEKSTIERKRDADLPEIHGQVFLDTGDFEADLIRIISTQDKWSKEKLLTIIEALKNNKYSK